MLEPDRDAPLDVLARKLLDEPLPGPTRSDWLAWLADEIEVAGVDRPFTPDVERFVFDRLRMHGG
jgi:hypothetical protein